MDIKSDQASRTSPGSWYIGQDPSKSEGSGNISFVLHTLRSSSGKKGKDEGEGRNEQFGQSVYN